MFRGASTQQPPNQSTRARDDSCGDSRSSSSAAIAGAAVSREQSHVCYAFTITYGASYKSYNKGTITANKLTGSFRDTNGSAATYSAVRT
jgi:hypothetical protein